MGSDYVHDNRMQNGSFVEWDLSPYVNPVNCYTVAAIWNANGSGTRATNVRHKIDHDSVSGTAIVFRNQNLDTYTFNLLSTDIGESNFGFCMEQR